MVVREHLVHSREAFRSEQRRMQSANGRGWKHALTALQDPGGGKAAWWVKQQPLKPLQFVLADDSRPLTRWWEQDAQLQRAWARFHQFSGGETDQTVTDAFCRRFRTRLQTMPQMESTELTGMMLRRAAFRHRQRTSPGACGWRSNELRWLPDLAWAELSQVFQVAEQARCLPVNLRWIWITLIPKPNAKGPFDLRPIGVTGLLYRTWTKAKQEQLKQWYVEHISQHHYGAVAHRSAEGVLARLSLEAEIAQSQQRGQELTGIKLDFSKFFDCLPWGPLTAMLRQLGCDPVFVDTYMQAVTNMQCRYRLPHRTLGSCWTRSRGLTQGCPLSPMMSNILTLPYLWLLEEKLATEGLEAQSFLYLDDFTVIGHSPRVPALAWECAQEYAALLALQIHVAPANPSKTGVFSTAGELHIQWTEEQDLPQANCIEALGKEIPLRGESLADPLSGHAEVYRRAHRIARLPIPSERKALLVTSLATSVLSYARLGPGVPKQQVHFMQAALFAAAMGRDTQPLLCAREIFQTLWMPLHRSHPVYSQVHILGRMLHELWHTKEEQVRLAWTRSTCGMGQPGVVHDFLQLAKTKGWKTEHPGVIQDAYGHEAIVQSERGLFLHHLRELGRCFELRALAHRRQDFDGIQDGVNRDKTLQYWKTLAPGHLKNMGRFVMMGGIQTSERAARHARKQIPPCPWCQSEPGETWTHAAWDCSAWEHLREVQIAQIEDQPVCFRQHGLVPQNLMASPKLIQCVQKQLFLIAKAMNEAHVQAGGWKQYTEGPDVPRPQRPRAEAVPQLERETYYGHELIREPLAEKQVFRCERCGKVAQRKYRFQKECQGPQPVRVRPDYITETGEGRARRYTCDYCGQSAGFRSRCRFWARHRCRHVGD